MVTAAVPVDISVTGRVDDIPTVTSPKARLLVLRVSVGVVTACPVPERVTRAVGLVEEALLTVTVPVAPPVAMGLNVTWSVTVC